MLPFQRQPSRKNQVFSLGFPFKLTPQDSHAPECFQGKGGPTPTFAMVLFGLMGLVRAIRVCVFYFRPKRSCCPRPPGSGSGPETSKKRWQAQQETLFVGNTYVLWVSFLSFFPTLFPTECFSPTAESFGVSAQIGSGVVRVPPGFHQGFHQGSTRVPPGFHQGSTRVPPSSTRVPPGFHQGSTRVPPGFHQGSTRVPPGFHQGSARAAGWCEH